MEENLCKEKIDEFFEQLLDVVVNFVNTSVEVVKILLATIIDVLEMFRNYPNKHIVCLEIHSKKKRIRRKNARRIMKWCIETKGEQK